MGNKILYRNYVWEDVEDANNGEGISDGEGVLSVSLPGDTLATDTFNLTIISQCQAEMYLLTSDGKYLKTSDGKYVKVIASDVNLEDYVYGEPLYYYRDDGMLIAKLYVISVTRLINKGFSFNVTSLMGLLERTNHRGGVYDGQTVSELLASIIGRIVEYTVAPEVASIPVYGLLPYKSRKENLKQLTFAEGLSIAKDSSGIPNFGFLTDATTFDIDDRLYEDGAYQKTDKYSGVNVYEHAYAALSSDVAKTLFDNTSGEAAVNKEIIFDNPCHDLSTTGTLEIGEHGANYAFVSGIGALAGKEYNHTTNIISKRIEGAATESIMNIKNMTLISAVNSENVANRVLSYYSSVKMLLTSMVIGTERPGDRVRFRDPFNKLVEGYIQSLDITLSKSTLKAMAKIAIGYTPTGYGNFYNNCTVLSSAISYTVPADTYKLRVVLISGGDGGLPGSVGEDGGTGYKNTPPGNGGAGGLGGKGGKILNVNLDVTPGQVINFVPGVGGAPNSSGTASTFGSLSSADGTVIENGFYNVFDKKRYGAKSDNGIDGGRGSYTFGNDGNSIIYNGITYYPGANTAHSPYYGGGGGAAVGANGGNAVYDYGEGGHGANATIPGANATVYGCGGSGGHGGGGGGQGYGYDHHWNESVDNGGKGGLGSVGGSGADGCALIMF